MKLIVVNHRSSRFITNIPREEIANVIENSKEYAKSINGDWHDSVKFIQRRWIFEPYSEVTVL